MIRVPRDRIVNLLMTSGLSERDVMACVVGVTADSMQIDELCPGWRALIAAPPRPGLGDMVAAGLEAVGITKDRVQAVASAVGIKDCGCAGRQAAWNLLGQRLGIGSQPPDTMK